MLIVDMINEKIEKIRFEMQNEKSVRNKEFLEERILVLEELILEIDARKEK